MPPSSSTTTATEQTKAARPTHRPLVIAAVMASMAMVAIEATIVSTVMPQIATSLGGLHLYSWVFASFLLAQTAMTVVFGKLSDLVGRKPVMFAGIAIFLIGSLLAGFAWSMPAMICFRLIQGVGAGAIQPVALTIVSDLYAVRERGKVQGYLASVWAVAAVLGPVLGALIVQKLSWAWIFWVNIPIGLLSAVGFWLFLREAPVVRRSSVDLAGAFLFTVGVAALMIALTEFGVGSDVPALIWSAGFAVTAALFVLQERRAPDPMVSFRLWGSRLVATVNGASMLVGMTLIGITTFLPMYVLVVLQRSSVVAGLALTMTMLGWPLGSTITARLIHRVGPWRMVVLGAVLIPLGAVAFALLRPDSSPLLAGAGSFVIGLGMGVLSLTSLIYIQESVEPAQRGVATASNIFSRNLGSALGATFFGAIFNFGLSRANGGAIVSEDQLQHLLRGAEGGGIANAANAAIRTALAGSLQFTFLVMLGVALSIIALALLVPRHGFGLQAGGTTSKDAIPQNLH